MTDGEALHAAVVKAPGDDGARLALADWYREQGGDEIADGLQSSIGRVIVCTAAFSTISVPDAWLAFRDAAVAAGLCRRDRE